MIRSATIESRIGRRNLIRGAAAALGIGLTGRLNIAHAAQNPTEFSLALDWYPNANHAGLYLALERGLFDDAGLAAEIYTPSDPTVVLQTVGAGQDTFGISYQTDVLLARAQDVPVVSIAALVQHPLLGIMSLASEGITRPADLAGKQIGYPGIPSQEAFLATMLETDGASLEDVELVNVGFDLVPAAISGQLAGVMGAYWTHETILAEREGHPVTMLRVEEWGVPDYYELVLVASEDTVADRPDLVASFLTVVAEGYTAVVAEPDAALDALEAASGDVVREVEAEGLALLGPEWFDGSTPFGHQDPSRWAAYAAWMAERDLIPADLDTNAAFVAGLIPAATPVATPDA